MEGADRCDRAGGTNEPGGIPAFRCVRCNEHRIGVSMATTHGPLCELCNLFVSVQYHPEESAMRGFRIAGAIALAIASVSSVVRPAAAQSLDMVAAAVEAEAKRPAAELPPCPQPTLGTLTRTAKPPVCANGKCTAAECAAGTCAGAQCASGAACPCETCGCSGGDCCTPATAAHAEHSVLAHRGHVFRCDAAFMDRGPARRLCGRVAGKLRGFIREGGPIRRALKARRGG